MVRRLARRLAHRLARRLVRRLARRLVCRLCASCVQVGTQVGALCVGVDGRAGCAYNGSAEGLGMRAGRNRYGSVARCNGKVTDWVRGAPNIAHIYAHMRAHIRKEVFVYARHRSYICGS